MIRWVGEILNCVRGCTTSDDLHYWLSKNHRGSHVPHIDFLMFYLGALLRNGKDKYGRENTVKEMETSIKKNTAKEIETSIKKIFFFT